MVMIFATAEKPKRLVRGAKNEHIDLVADSCEFGEQWRRLDGVAEASELDDEGAHDGRIRSCA